ncbi:MAG: hypothetical protein ASARMPRED_005873 [Alectoria sarmentosa]|nr:MAG: hypothetical protein ASARMPRED_005873 [Alectoria sarmentosa]
MSAPYSNPDAKVREIVNSCRSVNILHPVVTELCLSPEVKRIFWSSLYQDLHVICQRSQVFAHGEITAVQKAFAVLMEKKEDHIRAVHLYVDEILGLKYVSGTDGATTLNAMIQTRHAILGLQIYGSKPIRSSTSGTRALASSNESVLSNHKPVSEALFVSDGSEWSLTSDLPRIGGGQAEEIIGVDISQDLASRSKHCDEQLKRLFIVYHKARKDFDSTPTKTLERTKSAKFLRDTTENCLAYIAAKQNRPGGGSESEFTRNGKMLDELRATLEETIAIAEQGSGGKKRRFDENWENVPQEPARMRAPITRRRSDLPHQLYPASTGQSVRHVFGDGHKPHAERKTFSGRVYGDRYRPTYRRSGQT